MKKPARSRQENRTRADHSVISGIGSERRGWPVSIVWAVVLVGISVPVSASVNPLFGRNVHWDWMAVLAPSLFILLVFGLRRRWV